MAQLILASQSPRRKELMTLAGYRFEIFQPSDKEDFQNNIPIRDVAEHLAVRKATIALDYYKEDDIVIVAADTTVILNGEIYNKPADETDALRMLKDLNGRGHEVITGVCILSHERSVSFSDTTKVFFRTLTEEQLKFYIKHYHPFDKAGSYGIQDWFGVRGVERIEGDYFNVMGLPISRVALELENFGIC